MSFEHSESHYEVLEIEPTASSNEIREAYFRLKSTYSVKNPATYGVMDFAGLDSQLKRIHEAYEVLSNPSRKTEYDRNHGIISLEGFIQENINAVRERKQATPEKRDETPREILEMGEEALLISPTTDHFEAPSELSNKLPASHQEFPEPEELPKVAASPVDEFEELIRNESEWSGKFIQRVREARQISLDELCEATKITKRYLKAIENENFNDLPASVFVRGFLMQISKRLRLPQDKLTSGFLARYRQACPSKA